MSELNLSYIKMCAACPNGWQCIDACECLNARVIARTSEIQLLIAKGLDQYDASRKLVLEQRANDPMFSKPKDVDTKPVCWHNYSAAGICLSCGYWKAS